MSVHCSIILYVQQNIEERCSQNQSIFFCKQPALRLQSATKYIFLKLGQTKIMCIF